MAERRMFAKAIIDSDSFLDLPSSSQCLYFHLAMRADDDGFINAPKKIMRVVGASDDDIRLLIAKKFLIPFDSGVVVIKHWKIHNYIPKDRYKETTYLEEKSLLTVKKNGSYTLDTKCIQDGYRMDTTCIQNVSKLDTQVRLDKDRLDKVNNISHKYGKYQNVLLTDTQLETLKKEFPDNWEDWIERVSEYVATRGAKYKNFLAVIRSWARREPIKKTSYNTEEIENDIITKFMEGTL